MFMGFFLNLNYTTMNFQDNNNFFAVIEAVIVLLVSAGIIGLSFTMYFDNFLTNIFLMGFGFSIFIGAMYMLVEAIRE